MGEFDLIRRHFRRDGVSQPGNSSSTMLAPTSMAGKYRRQWCALARDASPVIHFESPVRVATLPSSVTPALAANRSPSATAPMTLRALPRKRWPWTRSARGARSKLANSPTWFIIPWC